MATDLPTILVITNLFPNASCTFLGTFVVKSLVSLSTHYRMIVIVPRMIRHHVAQPSLTRYGPLEVHFVRQYPYGAAVLWLLGLCSRQHLGVRHKKVVRKKIVALARKLHQQNHFSLVHGHEAYIGDEAVIVGQALGIPSVVTIHGLYEYHRQGWGERCMNQVMRHVNQADQLVAVSNIAADSYRNHGIEQPFLIIPNGIDIPQLPLPLPEAWQQVTRGKIVILAAGFFVPEKRFEQVISAAVKLRERFGNSFVVLIIGTGMLEPLYRRMIREHHMEHHVYVVGQVLPSAMPAYYAAADLLVHPSVVDSFSMVCLETMQAGKPFICVSNIGITEYITPGREALVVPPDDFPALVDAMDRLLRDPARRQAMGEAGYQTALQFQWQNVAPKIIAVYDQLIAAR